MPPPAPEAGVMNLGQLTDYVPTTECSVTPFRVNDQIH